MTRYLLKEGRKHIWKYDTSEKVYDPNIPLAEFILSDKIKTTIFVDEKEETVFLPNPDIELHLVIFANYISYYRRRKH